MRAPKENARTISKTQATLLYENSAFLAAGAIAAVTRIAKTGKTGIDSGAARRRHPRGVARRGRNSSAGRARHS
jgi:hypothetical protein